MYKNDTFDKFIKRLKDTRNSIERQEYDLGQAPGFKSTLTPELIKNIHQSILRNPDILKQIQALQPNGSLYIKRDRKDPETRSFCITRDASGEYCLMIEPKSKRSDSIKRMILWAHGSYKKRKIALRTDTPIPQVYASMITYSATEKALAAIKHEIAEQQIFDNVPGIAKIINGGDRIKLVENKQGEQVAITRTITYSPFREKSLAEYMFHNRGNISAEQRSDFIKQLVNIVKTLHDNKKEHKDIKDENIMVYFDQEKKKYMLELIDFGYVQNFGTKDIDRGTPAYLPVWGLASISAGLSLQKFKEKMLNPKLRSYAESYAFRRLVDNLQKQPEKDRVITSLGPVTVNGKHDIWSLAVLCYEIHYSSEMNSNYVDANLAKNKFVSSMLCDTPELTPNIDQVLVNFENSKYKTFADKLQPVDDPAADFEQSKSNLEDDNDVFMERYRDQFDI